MTCEGATLTYVFLCTREMAKFALFTGSTLADYLVNGGSSAETSRMSDTVRNPPSNIHRTPSAPIAPLWSEVESLWLSRRRADRLLHDASGKCHIGVRLSVRFCHSEAKHRNSTIISCLCRRGAVVYPIISATRPPDAAFDLSSGQRGISLSDGRLSPIVACAWVRHSAYHPEHHDRTLSLLPLRGTPPDVNLLQLFLIYLPKP